MKFSGRLQIEADPRNWLKTELNLNHGRLELVSGGDLLGSWSTAQVKAERVAGDKFQLHLGDDRAVFAADDALAFSYEALPVLAKKTVMTAATGLRGMLRKGLAGAERPGSPESQPHKFPEPTNAVDESQLDDPPVDAIVAPEPPRKLRDLIQAAVRSNMAETAPPEENTWRGPDAGSPDTDDFEQTVEEDDLTYEPDPGDQVWPEQPEAEAPDPLPLVEAGVASYVEEMSASDLPEIGHDDEPERPTFDLSPIFAEPAASYETNEGARPPRGIFDLEGTSFENGDTLGERPAEPFGWIRAAEEAMPAVALIDPSTPVIRSLDSLIDEVRNSAMSPAQVGAVTDLIRAVAEAIEDKNRP